MNNHSVNTCQDAGFEDVYLRNRTTVYGLEFIDGHGPLVTAAMYSIFEITNTTSAMHHATVVSKSHGHHAANRGQFPSSSRIKRYNRLQCNTGSCEGANILSKYSFGFWDNW